MKEESGSTLAFGDDQSAWLEQEVSQEMAQVQIEEQSHVPPVRLADSSKTPIPGKSAGPTVSNAILNK
ncbi:MAG: hypothetical protein Kow0056_17220 [Coriobacteriia bacterium]